MKPEDPIVILIKLPFPELIIAALKASKRQLAAVSKLFHRPFP